MRNSRLLKDFSCWLSIWTVLLAYFGSLCGAHHHVEEDTEYWMELGYKTVEQALVPRKIEGVAKNAILFVGDGMGMSTITAARIFKGQREQKHGEEGYLYFERFPHVALTKTYNVDRQVPDSAGTATALFSGIKGNYYTVGLDSHGVYNVCDPEIEEKARVTSLLDWAISAGKSTGLVTTTRITHATPAAAFGHSAHRDWECDSKIPETEREKGCKDLARQLVEDEPGKNINVIFGGGKQVLNGKLPLDQTDKGVCTRDDKKDLVYEWMDSHKQRKNNFKYVTNKQEMMDLEDDVTHVLGLFAPSHMPYDKDRNEAEDGQPSLTEMVKKAIDILQKNENGYILIVEGGRVDHAHHDNLAKIALEEVISLDDSILHAQKKANVNETLFVVTADHSHSMSINGYPKRGNPIEGVGDVTPQGYAYQTLSYINGPGYDFHRVASPVADANDTLKSIHTWKNLNDSDVKSELLERRTLHHAGYWMDYETHGGEDVPVYAIGPMAHLFHGVHEQTHVAFTIAYSTCIGPYKDKEKCRPGAAASEAKPRGPGTVHPKNKPKVSSAVQLTFQSSLVTLALTFILFFT